MLCYDYVTCCAATADITMVIAAGALPDTAVAVHSTATQSLNNVALMANIV